MIGVTVRGSFKNSEAFLNRVKTGEHIIRVLDKYGPIGVAALAAATPQDSGLAADSWDYEIIHRRGYYSLQWINRDVENDFHVAVMIQYGYGTRNGGYVHGRDYINPVMRPIFDQIAAEAWKEVTR